jgi:hypothetical protein
VPQVDQGKYPLYPSLQVVNKIREDPGLFRVERLSSNLSLFLPNNVLMAYGLSTVSGYESLAPLNIHHLPAHETGVGTRLFDLQNVRYLLTDPGMDLPSDRFTLLMQAQGIRLYENRGCLPRVQFVPHWQVVPNPHAMLDQMTSPKFDPQDLVLLDQEPPRAERSADMQSKPVTASATVRVRDYGPRCVVVDVTTAGPGVVLLADTWYPGWKARLDGQPTRLYRADYILKGVFVPPGKSEVEFYYAPLSFRVGAAISLGTVICVAVVGLWLAIRRRRQTGGLSAW